MRNAALLALAAIPIFGQTNPIRQGVYLDSNYCPEGAVNNVALNYLGPAPQEFVKAAGIAESRMAAHGKQRSGCMYLLQVSRRDTFDASGWVFLDEWNFQTNMAKSHELQFRIGRCGVILREFGGWEDPGTFYPGDTLRVQAVIQPPCV